MIDLLFQKEVIGKISIDSRENAWIYGSYELFQNAGRFVELFEAMTHESGFDEAYFDEEWLNDENWFINDRGKRFGITIPAIYADDGVITFRLREMG